MRVENHQSWRRTVIATGRKRLISKKSVLSVGVGHFWQKVGIPELVPVADCHHLCSIITGLTISVVHRDTDCTVMSLFFERGAVRFHKPDTERDTYRTRQCLQSYSLLARCWTKDTKYQIAKYINRVQIRLKSTSSIPLLQQIAWRTPVTT